MGTQPDYDEVEHRAKTISGMNRAKKVRLAYLGALLDGKISFHEMVKRSRDLETDNKYIGKLRLILILSSQKGWTKTTALEVLRRHGFTEQDNVKSIRARPTKVQLFSELMQQSPERWRQRPKPPPGWPWQGKLAVLIGSVGEKIPEELLNEIDEDVRPYNYNPDEPSSDRYDKEDSFTTVVIEED